jgi:mono/diheme cytochrome c family protein
MWKPVSIGVIAALSVIVSFATAGCATFLAAPMCAGGSAHSTPAPTVRSQARHDRYVRSGAPEPYRGKRNPLATSIGNIVDGARLYDLRCAVCHGMMGVGDGEAGERLDIPPADLSRSLGQPLYKDDFFLWSISEGGGEFTTDMPLFKNDLSERQIWRILTFMRAAFAESGDNPTAKDATAPP